MTFKQFKTFFYDAQSWENIQGQLQKGGKILITLSEIASLIFAQTTLY